VDNSGAALGTGRITLDEGLNPFFAHFLSVGCPIPTLRKDRTSNFPLQKFLESTILYGSTFFLGLLLGGLCDVQELLNSKIAVEENPDCIILPIAVARRYAGGFTTAIAPACLWRP